MADILAAEFPVAAKYLIRPYLMASLGAIFLGYLGATYRFTGRICASGTTSRAPVGSEPSRRVRVLAVVIGLLGFVAMHLAFQATHDPLSLLVFIPSTVALALLAARNGRRSLVAR